MEDNKTKIEVIKNKEHKKFAVFLSTLFEISSSRSREYTFLLRAVSI